MGSRSPTATLRETRYVRSRGCAVAVAGGKDVLESFVADVTEEARSNLASARGGQQLRRERDLVERVFETSPVGLGGFSWDGLDRFHDRAAEIYGSPAADTDGRPAGATPGLRRRRAVGSARGPARRPAFEAGQPVAGWEC